MAVLYLQLRAGPVCVLVEATGVHEVLAADRSHVSSRRQMQWRDQVLPVIELRSFFGFEESGCETHVVYSVDGADGTASPLVFAANEVLGLHQVDAHEWKRLPALPAEITRYFDAAYVTAGQDGLSYRLRAELEPTDFGVEADTQLQ